MKKYFDFGFYTVLISFLLSACNLTTPEEYFDQAVLNANKLVGFAGDGMYRQLESPSVKLNQATGQSEPMQRSEVVKDQITFAEESLKKLNDLPPTEETKVMLQASVDLYKYVLPVYKNDYTELAKHYDSGALKQETEAEAQAIQEKYAARFEELYNKLIALGKPYAAKHKIKVNWDR